MCRHLAYLGPPITLADLVLYQPHSLVHQSFAPNDMRGGGTINADGFGIGWLAADPGEPPLARRYRRDRPIWSDASLPDLAASISSGAIVAAVRNATAGMPVTETACAPFVEASWMFSHNGVIDGWPATAAPLADALPPADVMTMEAATDSAFLWVLVRQQLREGRSAAMALVVVVDEVLALAPRSRLNLLLHDGQHIAATAVGHSLWVRAGEDGVTVSSEPLNPAQDWQLVPDLSLLEATASQHTITPLDQGPP
jgi:gamma-glutamyl hercynylcysteine S-oxide hydrolase